MKKILKYCFNTSLWVPTKLEWIQLLSSISKDERERVTRFAFKRDSKQTLIGQMLIKYCLKNLLNIDWNNLCLGRTAKGRPYLKLKETLNLAKMNNFEYLVDFNVSHNGDYTIISAGIISSNSKKLTDDFDESFRIGTDVMKIDVDRIRALNPSDSEEAIYQKELDKHERVIDGKFTDAEKNFIYNKTNPVEKLSAFYRLWCIKESYIKALGDGMGFDIRRIECTPNNELFIDLMSKKHLVVDNTLLHIDSKLIKNCKFYEQYFSSNLVNREPNSRPHLHIMTVCIIEKVEKEKIKEKENKTSSSANAALSNDLINIQKSELEEFVEINLKDILPEMVVLEKIDDANNQEFEEHWLRFTQKAENP